MEFAVTAAALKVAYNLVLFGIKLDQVPAAVRRCLELVRTCHIDLEDLIKLRNEALPMLEARPAILERVNTIIQNAHEGLLEVARLVEKLRPEVHNGSSPFKSRLEWLFTDSREFTSQEPLIARQHSSVIAELNLLRQLVLLTPLIGESRTGQNTGTDGQAAKRAVVAWDNVALLDEMLGGNKQPSASGNGASTGWQGALNTHPWQLRSVSPAASVFTDLPPPYSSPRPGSALPSIPQPPTEVRNPFIYNANIPNAQWSGTSCEDHDGLGSKTRTTFDSGGIPFLFSDTKKAPARQEVTAVQLEQPDRDTVPRSQRSNSHDTTSYAALPFPTADPLSTVHASRHMDSHGWHPQGTTQHPPSSQQQYLYAVPELVHRYGSFDGPLQPPSSSTQTTATPAVASAPVFPGQAYTWGQINVPGHQACPSSTIAVAAGVVTYATTREYWRPEYLIREHGRQQVSSGPNPVLAPWTNNGISAAKLPSASASNAVILGQDAHNHSSFSMLHGSPPYYGPSAESGRMEISELSAVVFPPDLAELE